MAKKFCKQQEEIGARFATLATLTRYCNACEPENESARLVAASTSEMHPRTSIDESGLWMKFAASFDSAAKWSGRKSLGACTNLKTGIKQQRKKSRIEKVSSGN